MSTFADKDYDESIFDEMRSVAKNDWEHKFIDDMDDKHQEYGGRTYVSERQCEIIDGLLRRYALLNQ